MNNYDLSSELKEKIKFVLNKKIDEWLAANALKVEYATSIEILKDSTSYYDTFESKTDTDWSIIKPYKSIKDILYLLLFYSDSETTLLVNKIYYNNIKGEEVVLLKDIYNKSSREIFYKLNNLNNYIWRTILRYIFVDYTKSFKREQDSRKLRANILEKLK
jgi:hypothetical protein